MAVRHRFSHKATELLRYYVYLYVDPRNDEVFYVGKGKGNQAFSHLKARTDHEKVRVLRELAKLNLEPQIEILKYGLTEAEAFHFEANAKEILRMNKLKKNNHGQRKKHGLRGNWKDVAAQLEARQVNLAEPGVLILISRAFRYGMTPQELYDVTRSAWKVGEKREKAEYAFAVYRGIVREVYKISRWVPGGTTMQTGDKEGQRKDELDRWEFVGKVADDVVRKRYLGKSVRHYFSPGAQNPIQYVNVG